MPKNVVVNAEYKCQQAVIDKIGIENLHKSIKIGVKIKKIFNDGYDLISYLYHYAQRNKFLWLERASFELNVDVNSQTRWKM